MIFKFKATKLFFISTNNNILCINKSKTLSPTTILMPFKLSGKTQNVKKIKSRGISCYNKNKFISKQ